MDRQPAAAVPLAVPAPRGSVVPLTAAPATYAAAVDRYRAASGITPSSARLPDIPRHWGVAPGRRTGPRRARTPRRHASIRSLERYARPGAAAVAAHVAALDPNTRRRPH